MVRLTVGRPLGKAVGLAVRLAVGVLVGFMVGLAVCWPVVDSICAVEKRGYLWGKPGLGQGKGAEKRRKKRRKEHMPLQFPTPS